MSAQTAHQVQEHDHRRDSTTLKVVDTDVHHGTQDESNLCAYLPKIYREQLADYGFGGKPLWSNNGGRRGIRVDVEASSVRETRVVDVEAVKSQLLDGCNVEVAVLTGGEAYAASVMPEVDYASAICRAFNDYTLEHWLAADDRFRFAMAVNPQDPAGAAEEIERIGDHPQVVAIMIPCGATRPYGHRSYHRMYEACSRHGLAVALHFGTEGIGVNPSPTAAGYPSYYIESRLARPSFYQVHLASFIFEGVFERFPTLKVAMLEGGFGWVPAYRWRMDVDWKGLRRQTPWVKRLPSEYIRDHVRFSCQPMDEPEGRSDLRQIVEWMDGDRTLMFASDYPHWDWENPAETFPTFDPELRQRIFVENARETFGL